MIRHLISFQNQNLVVSLADIGKGAISVNSKRTMVSSLQLLRGNGGKAYKSWKIREVGEDCCHLSKVPNNTEQ